MLASVYQGQKKAGESDIVQKIKAARAGSGDGEEMKKSGFAM